MDENKLRAAAYAAQGDDILGIWNNVKKTLKYSMQRKILREDHLCQRTDLMGRLQRRDPDTPRLDDNNPAAAKRCKSIIGGRLSFRRHLESPI
jgi:hypothetical protein